MVEELAQASVSRPLKGGLALNGWSVPASACVVSRRSLRDLLNHRGSLVLALSSGGRGARAASVSRPLADALERIHISVSKMPSPARKGWKIRPAAFDQRDPLLPAPALHHLLECEGLIDPGEVRRPGQLHRPPMCLSCVGGAQAVVVLADPTIEVHRAADVEGTIGTLEDVGPCHRQSLGVDASDCSPAQGCLGRTGQAHGAVRDLWSLWSFTEGAILSSSLGLRGFETVAARPPQPPKPRVAWFRDGRCATSSTTDSRDSRLDFVFCPVRKGQHAGDAGWHGRLDGQPVVGAVPADRHQPVPGLERC